MTNKEKSEELKFIIGRFDHYYDSINNKGNLYLTLNTFILAGSVAGYFTLNQSLHFGRCVLVFCFIPLLLCNLISFTCTLLAIRPFARRIPNSNALMYFADVSQYRHQTWKQRWQNLVDAEWQTELETQAHQLAKGLDKKFTRLSFATLFIWLQAAMVVIFSIYLLTI